MATKFWGETFGIGAGLLSAPFIAYDTALGAIFGKPFAENFERKFNAVYDACAEFGDEHDAQITKVLVLGATSAIGMALGNDAHAAAVKALK